MKLNGAGSGEPRLETIISYLLLAGAVISLCFEIAGIVLFFHSYGNIKILLDNPAVFVQGQNFFAFLYSVFRREGMLNPVIFLMTLGIAILILTPYVRVAASFVYFVWRRDPRYVLITAFVLIIISISLALH